MITTEENPERALLVGLCQPQDEATFDAQMAELARLAETAGALTVRQLTQRRPSADSRFLIGKGKLDELTEWVEAENIDTVIFNNRLSPRQNRNLEELLKVKVIDRMQLILDIFAQRARTREAQLQVEAAQLAYLLPRLTGQGIMLSRQAGGIGSRGPGESQLELDRRKIRGRLEDIEAQLTKVEKTRATQRKRRQLADSFRIGLIGYTNAGKSSIMNAFLADSNAEKPQYERDELFATLDATTKKIQLAENFEVSLTDTVGFIQNLPTELVKAFKSTLEESADVDLLLEIIDASDPEHAAQEAVVADLLTQLDLADIPRLVVYNKMDAVERFSATLTPSVELSIKSVSGLMELRAAILAKIREIFVPFSLLLLYEKSHKLPELRKIALIDTMKESEHGYALTGRVAPRLEWKINELNR